MSPNENIPWECNLYYEDGSHGRLEYYAATIIEACSVAQTLIPRRPAPVVKAIFRFWRKEQPVSDRTVRAVAQIVGAMNLSYSAKMYGLLPHEWAQLDAIADLLQR